MSSRSSREQPDSSVDEVDLSGRGKDPSASFDPHRVEAVLFDSYSTLVDVDSAEEALQGLGVDPVAVSRQWRSRSLFYTQVANHIDDYRPFYELIRLSLRRALRAHGVDPGPDVEDEILSIYHRLRAFDDVRPGLIALRDAGYPVYVLSNGNPEMLDSMVEGAGIGDLLRDVISADEIRRYKPAPELYQHGATRVGKPLDRLLHVSAGWFDVQGAIHSGMQAAWLNRSGSPWEPFGPRPSLVVGSVLELAPALEGGGVSRSPDSA